MIHKNLLPDPSNSCILCNNYRKGICASPEIEIFRQTNNNSYELYYPYKRIIKKVAKALMLSTVEVLEILQKEYSIKIPRTTIFDFQRYGLLKKENKIGLGDKKGVKTYWDVRVPLKLFYINRIKEYGLTIKEIIKFHDQLYNLRDDLKYYEMYVDDHQSDVIWPVYEKANPIETSKFNTFLLFIAAYEAGLKNYNLDLRGGIPEIEIFENEPEKNNVLVAFLEKDFHKDTIVLFKKGEVKVKVLTSEDNKSLKSLAQWYEDTGGPSMLSTFASDIFKEK